MRWTVTDFRGNSVEFEANDFESALDIAYDEYRQPLYGNAEHWEITSASGEHYPRQSDYDWETNEYGYER